MAKIAIIGSGFSGLSAAAYLSQEGHAVEVFEKNSSIGGRARQLKTENGFTFDMGPSWYWMPDVFENFFKDFGHSVSQFYDLVKLNPAFEIVYDRHETLKIPNDTNELYRLFEEIEEGSSKKLELFMKEAEFKYKTAFDELIYKPGLSITEFANFKLISSALRIEIFTSFSKHVAKYFKHPKLLALMEFPILFLGATAQNTPALYSLMNYAGLKLGTWYPQGGFYKVVEAIEKIVITNGVKINLNAEVTRIKVKNNKATSLTVNGWEHEFDAVLCSCDYHHAESILLEDKYKNYNENYWSKKSFAPSCLIYYLGLNKKIKGLLHHTLFFDEDFNSHANQIYTNPKWPDKPLFYVCCPSKTDASVAPENCENIFLLMPLAPGLEDTENLREIYFEKMMARIENKLGENIREFICYKKSYCVNDFIYDYNSYKGNAYGLANTLSQTAFLKPKMVNKKVKNLFYTGQLTVPGPGVPPSIISGKIAANLINNYLKQKI